MKTSPKRRSLAMVAGVTATALTLAACGGGDDGGDSELPEDLPPNPPSRPSGGPPAAPSTTG